MQHPTICSGPELGTGAVSQRLFSMTTCMPDLIHQFLCNKISGWKTRLSSWIRGRRRDMLRYKTDFSRDGRKIPSAPQASRPVTSHSLTFSMALSSSDRQGLIQYSREKAALGKPQPTRALHHTCVQPHIGLALETRHHPAVTTSPLSFTHMDSGIERKLSWTGSHQ